MFPKPHLYGLFVALGLCYVYFYTKYSAKRFGLSFQKVENAFLFCLLGALIGARAYHVLSSLPYYLAHPFSILSIWEGGLGIFGAILGGLVTLFIYNLKNKRDFWPYLNLLAPPLLLAQAIGRIGNFFNQEGFGLPTNQPWGIPISLANRPINFIQFEHFHPTFFYESIMCSLAFMIYLLANKQTKKSIPGFAYYLTAYGLIRILTESYRIDTWKIGSFQVAYVWAGLMILAGIGLWLRRNKTNSL